ncbi:hypothetical protein GLI01_23250 [Gluconacetobacter liquefaciens]|uniref:Uncharacterized protein n=1 Tax=Gluconacetobacter liquefaciens TaxID=89584 RepID=A0A370GB25_GLULI|nr:hypothetical protein [Gluconacetobacter liquefaciens]MBB2184836.1 hypothetical protein [Gluconacetobacter liquefaciens]RDI40259.1 hypothetical protein C7453_10146 [Gluconacetobacter liquefaciens]GEB38290.1 hypothetical protein GLI01_23250 [Gluconacetobacter liquefaciens]
MAEHAHSTPAPTRAAESRAHILAALIAPFLIALAVFGLGTPDPVTTGRPTAIEVVR